MSEERRQDYSAILAVLDEQFKNLREANQREHETILRKIEIHNGFGVKLAELTEYCEEMRMARLRERVKGIEVYLKVGIALVVFSFGLFGWFIQHTLTILAKKLAGG